MPGFSRVSSSSSISATSAERPAGDVTFYFSIDQNSDRKKPCDRHFNLKKIEILQHLMILMTIRLRSTIDSNSLPSD
jgi:hypothetical protein